MPLFNPNPINIPLYGTSGQSLTITMAEANGTAANCTAVDNTSTLYQDIYLFFTVLSNASSFSATGYFNFYGYGSVDGGTTYPEGITSAAGNPTLTVPPNLILLAQMNVVAANKTYTMGPISFCRTYGCDQLPAKWGIVAVNQSGFTTQSGSIKYQGINLSI